MKKIGKHVIDLISSVSLTRESLDRALWPRNHSSYLTRSRADIVISRIQLVSAAFSILTVVWIAIDYWAFPFDLWWPFAALRILSGFIFFMLALPWEFERGQRTAMVLFVGMMANPPLFYLLSIPLFAGAELSGPALLVSELYMTLPFIMVAGLGVFPLTVLEMLAFAIPSVGIAVLGRMWAGVGDWPMFAGQLWQLFLLVGVLALACSSQLVNMISMVRRISQDPLTGVYTRRTGGEIVELQFGVSKREGTPLTIAYFDLDKFKSVNDDHGHEAGDRVLRKAAHAMRDQLRKTDTLVRWGGEEFLIVMTGTDNEGAKLVMGRMMEHWLGERPEGGPVTASIGLAERIEDGADDWPQLVETADRRMYDAKQRGRARCIGSDGEEVTGPPPQ